jgi:hypothetical protein
MTVTNTPLPLHNAVLNKQQLLPLLVCYHSCTHFHVSHINSPVQFQASSRSQEGSGLRRGVLKGAVVAFITAGYSGKR